MTFFNFLLLAVILYRIFKWIWKDGKPKAVSTHVRQERKGVEEMKQDPVCGTYVPASLAVTSTYKDTTIYFCSNDCRDKFNKK